MMAQPANHQPRWHFAAAIAAWLLPGLGHLLLGDRRRAAILAVGIGGLWVGGLLIGGVSIIEARTPPGSAEGPAGAQFQPWFLGQMLIAPSLLVERYHQRTRRLYNQQQGNYGDQHPKPAGPGQPPPPYSPAYGRAYEQGTLYTSLAGLLNLLAIMDVMYRTPRHRDHVMEEEDEEADLVQPDHDPEGAAA